MSWEYMSFEDVPEFIVETGDKAVIFDWIEENHPVKVARTVGWGQRVSYSDNGAVVVHREVNVRARLL